MRCGKILVLFYPVSISCVEGYWSPIQDFQETGLIRHSSFPFLQMLEVRNAEISNTFGEKLIRDRFLDCLEYYQGNNGHSCYCRRRRERYGFTRLWCRSLPRIYKIKFVWLKRDEMKKSPWLIFKSGAFFINDFLPVITLFIGSNSWWGWFRRLNLSPWLKKVRCRVRKVTTIKAINMTFYP